jgi:hypothetical protein
VRESGRVITRDRRDIRTAGLKLTVTVGADHGQVSLQGHRAAEEDVLRGRLQVRVQRPVAGVYFFEDVGCGGAQVTRVSSVYEYVQ